MAKLFNRALICLWLLSFGCRLDAMLKAPPKEIAPVQAIGVKTLKFEDAQRGRPVVVELWYPIDRSSSIETAVDDIYIHPKESRNARLSEAIKQYPLIMMSHGHRGDRRDRSWLAERLVKANFIVASVEHFGNSRSTFNPILTLKYWERARDISFALDQILKEPLLEGRIALNRVGFAGYSLGGMTGLALAGCTVDKLDDAISKNKEALAEFPPEALSQIDFSESACRQCDPRIHAALLIAPANFLYNPESLKQIKIPIGLVSAINDEVLPHQNHSQPIIQHAAPVKLKVLPKEISHFAFLNPVSEIGKKLLPAKVQSDPACCSRLAIHNEVGNFAVEFFRENLN